MTMTSEKARVQEQILTDKRQHDDFMTPKIKEELVNCRAFWTRLLPGLAFAVMTMTHAYIPTYLFAHRWYPFIYHVSPEQKNQEHYKTD